MIVMRNITLKHLTERIIYNKRFLEKYPDKKDLLEKHMGHDIELVIKCLEQNRNNPLLSDIILSDSEIVDE